MVSKGIQVYVFMPARNEEKTLPPCLRNLQRQTLHPKKILVIDDASTDSTLEICKEFNVDVITLTKQHENYVTTPALAYKMAEVLNHAFPPPQTCEYMMQHNPDTILPVDYIENVTTRMENAHRLVVASGRIAGEYSRLNHPRATGRMYKMWFWRNYIKEFPLNYSYETYPLLKAQSLGLYVQCFHDVVMTTLRWTKQYKADYGYAMRELGYSFPYILGKCVVGLRRMNLNSLRLLYSYLTSPYKLKDPELMRFMKYYQVKQFIDFKALIRLLG